MSESWGALRAEDYAPGEECIKANVGGVMRIIDMHAYLTVHTAVADRLRAAGLQGRALDVAIHEELPRALAARLDATTH